MTQTQKQRWDALRGVVLKVDGVRTAVVGRPHRQRGQCPDCPHGWKHHTAGGHCRRSCSCTQGRERAK